MWRQQQLTQVTAVGRGQSPLHFARLLSALTPPLCTEASSLCTVVSAAVAMDVGISSSALSVQW